MNANELIDILDPDMERCRHCEKYFRTDSDIIEMIRIPLFDTNAIYKYSAWSCIPCWEEMHNGGHPYNR